MSVAMGSDEEEEKKMGKMAQGLGESILEGRFWEMKGDVKIG